MKITKGRLRALIRESLNSYIEEADEDAESRAPENWWKETLDTVQKTPGIDDEDHAREIAGKIWDEELDDDERSDVRKEFGEK